MAALLSGCDTTGGAIGNLVPAPKFLRGSIKNRIYSAPDNFFSVTVPQKEGSYEYQYMKVKEQYGATEIYVSFGPAAIDQTIYRLDIAKRVTAESQRMRLDDLTASRLIESAKAQVGKAYKGELMEVMSGKETINGKPCYHWRFTQTVPAGIMISNRQAVLDHDVYAVDLGKGVASIWVQSLDGNPAQGMSARAFAESLVVN